MESLLRAYLTLMAVWALAGSAMAGGTVAGRVVLVGEPPAADVFDPGPDTCCQQAAPSDERWVVGQEGGLANVTVVVETDHPSTETPSEEPVVMKNDECAFRPRVVLVQTGQTFVMENADPATHNMNANMRRNGAFNLVLPPGDRREVKLDRAESKPVTMACNIHPFMRGYVFVLDHAHAAVTDESGAFVIEGLPAGEARIRFWHEGRAIAEAELVHAEGTTQHTDARGRIVVEIPSDGPLELGELRVTGPNE